MLANEAKFLGPKFMGVRWILTSVLIFLMAYLLSKIVKKENIPMEEIGQKQNKQDQEMTIREQYCMGCGICVRISPNNFKLEKKKAKVKRNYKDHKDTEGISQAIEKCPSKAISLTN